MRAFILRRVELIAHGHRRRRARRIDAFRRHAAHQGVPDPQRPSVRVHRPRPRRRTSRHLLDQFHVARQRRPGADLPRRRGAAEPDQSSRSPTASASTTRSTRRTCATSSSSAPGRRGSRRPSTARRRGSTSWCSSRTRRADRPGRARRSRTTSAFPTGISGQELAARALHAGAEVRRPADDRARPRRGSPATRKPYAIEIDDGPRRAGARPSSSRPARSTASSRSTNLSRVRRRRRVLRRDLHRGAAVRRRRGRRRRAAATRPARPRCSSRRRRRRVHMLVRSDGLAEQHVAVSDPAHRGEPGHRRCGRAREIVGARRRAATSSACAGADGRSGSSRDARHPPCLPHDRRRAEHRLARRLRRARRTRVHQDRARSVARTIWPRRAGRSPGRRICSRPACPACSRSATCGAATSSAWRQPSARDRSPSRSSIAFLPNRGPARGHSGPNQPAPGPGRTGSRPSSRFAARATAFATLRGSIGLATWFE